MTKAKAAPEIIYDPSCLFRKPSRGASSQRHADVRGRSVNQDNENEEIDINKILKDIQYLGSASMSWKERKKLENEKVVSLGGKAPKKHRVPLSVGKFQFKKQKQREQKKIEEEQILGRFSRHSNNRRSEKRKPEDRVLKASDGHFSKGVLNVKHLLERKPSSGVTGALNSMFGDVKKKGKSRGKSKGKGKGKGKKRGH